MANTQVQMVRFPTVINGTNIYEIDATCLFKGTLPDTSIFLLQINIPTSPKDDSLQRVVSIQDTVTYKSDRDLAIAAGDTLWRSTALILRYPDIETANAAWKELSARINTLVDNVDTILTEFDTPIAGTTIVYPTADVETVAAAEAAYLATAAAVTAAQVARDAEQNNCANVLQTELNDTNARLADATADLANITLTQAQLSSYLATLNAVRGSIGTEQAAARALNATSSATTGEKAAIEAQFDLMDEQLTLFSGTNTNIGTLNTGLITTQVTTLQSRVSTLTTNRNNLISQLNICNATVSRLQGVLDAAREQQNSALAAVLAVCPNYVPPT